MEHINIRANAKINLTLDVLDRREDGYHNINSVMQTLKLNDRIFIKKIVNCKIKIVTNLPWLPVDNRNIVHKAINLIQQNYNINNGVFVEITKNIPVSAGLAGGSADCSAVLIALRKLYDLKIPNKDLYAMGKELGADVPYCIMGGTVLAQGIGEKLTKLPPHPPVHVLLVKPPISISTTAVYNNLDLATMPKRSDQEIEKMLEALKTKKLRAIAKSFYNSLEHNVIQKHPSIQTLKDIMLKHKALGALMSGSGPTVFGYFVNRWDAISAMKEIGKYDRSIEEIHLTSIFNKKSSVLY